VACKKKFKKNTLIDFPTTDPGPAALVRHLISKILACVLHIVHRTECCSIFSKASIEDGTALSNVKC